MTKKPTIYQLMPGAVPARYVKVSLCNDGTAQIHCHGDENAKAPTDQFIPTEALERAQEIAAEFQMPLFVEAPDYLWDNEWGELQTNFYP